MRSIRRPICVLAAVTALLVAFLLEVAAEQIECTHLDRFPVSLNEPEWLSAEGEVHVFGTYYLNASARHDSIAFSIQQSSVFRVYVAPTEIDVDLLLFKGTDMMSSLMIGTEESIFDVLPPGDYRLDMTYFPGLASSSVPACPSVDLELTIVPEDRAGRGMSACRGEPSVFPSDLDLTPLADGRPVHYDSQAHPLCAVTPPGSAYTALWATNITLPHPTGRTGVWRVRAILSAPFLAAGSLGLLLAPTSRAGALTAAACQRSPSCVYGAGAGKDQHVLRGALPPGQYTLVIYDNGYRNATLFPCMPFALDVDLEHMLEPENGVSCPLPAVPTSLNAPGLMSAGGRLLWAAPVWLDPTRPRMTIAFQTTAPLTLFRMTAGMAALDVDLHLGTADAPWSLGSSISLTGEEGVLAELPPGSYQASIAVYGIDSGRGFCDAVTLAFAAAPAGEVSTSCPTAQVLPDLSALASALRDGVAYRTPDPHMRNVYLFSGNFSQAVIQRQALRPAVPTTLEGRLSSDLLTSDVLFYLLDKRTGRRVASGERGPRFSYMRADLQPGIEYELVLATGVTQSLSMPPLPHFPPCAQFFVDIRATPSADAPCTGALPLTESLSTDGLATPGTQLRFAGDVLWPTSGGALATVALPLQVPQPSLLRVYLPPHRLDVDLRLERAGAVNQTRAGFNTEESLLSVLDPDVPYVLNFVFFDLQLERQPCETFNLEFAVVPLSQVDDTAAGADCPTRLEPSTLPILVNTELQTALSFRQQSSEPLELQWPVVLNETAALHAWVQSDFAHAALSLRLTNAFGNQTLGTAQRTAARAHLGPLVLPAGSYVLSVYETVVAPAALASCGTGTVGVSVVAMQASEVVPRVAQPCAALPLPAHFDSPGMVSALTGGQLYLAMPVLIDTATRREERTFPVTVTSVVRVRLADHPLIDADVVLLDPSVSPARELARGAGRAGEHIGAVVPAGTYRLVFTYYARSTGMLPPPSMCPTVDMEVAVLPVSALAAAPCTTQLPRITAGAPVLVDGRFQRSLADSAEFDFAFNLTLAVRSVVRLGVRSSFGRGPLDLTVQSTDALLTAFVAENHQYVTEALPAGTHTVRLRDRFGVAVAQALDAAGVHCAPYAFHAEIIGDASGDGGGGGGGGGGDDGGGTVPGARPEPGCVFGYALPTDLFTTTGGSRPFGGPQQADGTVRISGTQFTAPTGTQPRVRMVTLRVTQPSLLRVFVSAADPSTDIDVMVYRVTGNDSHVLVFASMDSAMVESALLRLEPASDGTAALYQLSLYFFQARSCASFALEVALTPVARLLPNAACPAMLPSPPPLQLTVRPGGVVNVFDDRFAFRAPDVRARARAGMFRYATNISLPGNSTLQATLGFDFLSADMSLVLRSPGGRAVATSQWRLAPVGGPYGFLAVLSASVPQRGHYVLEIQDDSAALGLLRDAPETVCMKFSYSLRVESSAHPVLVGVVPAGGYLDPSAPAELVIQLSEPAALPLHLNSLAALFTLQARDQSPLPASSVAAVSATSLRVSFTRLQPQTLYTLHIDAPQLRSLRDQSPFSASGLEPQYWTTACQCNEHGTCDDAGNCRCESAYAGSYCELCAVGFHRAGAACVANVVCQPDTCHGHGQCRDADGYPVCDCDDGFTTVADQQCAACAADSTGRYPNCTLPRGPQSDSWCPAPRLPTTLDTPGQLLDGGRATVEGWFYLDLDHPVHQIRMTLREPSVLRAYVAPHHIDIDLWLSMLRPDGSRHLVDAAISVGEEEVVRERLGPGVYELQLVYYNWEPRDREVCNELNLVLAVRPEDELRAEAARVAELCGQSERLPLLFNTPETRTVIGRDGYAFSSTDGGRGAYQMFCTAAAQPRGGSHSRAPHFIGAFHFEVRDGTTMLSATVGSRFTLADVGLLLEDGSAADHCGSTPGASPNCYNAQSGSGRQIMRRPLFPGNYSLWVYEPRAQLADLSAFAAFDLDVRLTPMQSADDPITCAARRLPDTLNAPGYLGQPSLGYLHLLDDFLLDFSTRERQIEFEVSVPSLVRAHVPAHRVDIDLLLMERATATLLDASATFNEDDVVVAAVPAGRYSLVLRFFLPHDVNPTAATCEVFRFEMAIEPQSRVQSALGSLSCGVSPLRPETISQLPYRFQATGPLYAPLHPNASAAVSVAMFTLELHEEATVRASVASSFVAADLALRLTGRPKPIFGTLGLNTNTLEATLPSGTYSLTIVQPKGTLSTVRCAPFDLTLTVTPGGVPDRCPTEPLPTTLNSAQYLGAGGRVHLHGARFAIPDSAFFASHTVRLQVDQESLFRAYLEPHVVDIDLKLYGNGTQRVASALVAEATSLNQEEALAVVLKPGRPYELDLLFFRWGRGVRCDSFSMELSITPLSDLAPALRQSVCSPAGGDALPQLPAAPPLPYSYADWSDLFMQQRLDAPRRVVLPLKLTAPTRLYVAVGGRFELGAPAVRVERNHTVVAAPRAGQDLRYAWAENLPAGEYDIVLYEPQVQAAAVLSCTHFSFMLALRPAAAVHADLEDARIAEPLPAQLDTVPYLLVDGRTQLAGVFAIPSAAHTMSFALGQPSVFRAALQPHVVDLDLYLYNDSVGAHTPLDRSINFYTEDSIARVLPVGRYSLRVVVVTPWLVGSAPTFVFELAIEPLLLLPPPPVDCAPTAPPELLLSPGGRADVHTDALRAALSQPVLLHYTFTLAQPSLFVAQTRSLFGTADISVRLDSNDVALQSGTPFAHTLVATARHNRHDLRTLLQPGGYNVTVYQPATLGASSPWLCAAYGLTLHLAPYSNEDDHGCLGFVVPWDLNRPHSGADAFGGPVDPTSGVLTLFGDQFRLPVERAGSSDSIALEVWVTSWLRVDVRPNSPRSTTELDMRERGSRRVPARHSLQGALESTALYRLTPGNYSLSLRYTEVDNALPCPLFALYAALRPVPLVDQRAVCAGGLLRVPAAVGVDAAGYGSVLAAGTLPKSVMLSHMHGGVVAFDLELRLEQLSRLDAVVAFDSVASFFTIQLRSDSRLLEESVGGAGGLPGATQPIDAQHALRLQVAPGNYTLRLLQRGSPWLEADAACVPLVLDVQVAPAGAPGYVRAVQPPGAELLPPNAPLTVTLVLSAPPYAPDGEAITPAARDMVRAALEMSGADGSVVEPASLSGSRDAVVWEAVFPSERFHPNVSYTLRLRSGILFDAQGHPLEMRLQPRFSFAAQVCSGRGTEHGGLCVCEDGYAGPSCGVCAYGFVPVGHTAEGVPRCTAIPGFRCAVDTCGCVGNSSLSGCVARGACNDSTGVAVCTCRPEYAGDHCERCAGGYFAPADGVCTPQVTCPAPCQGGGSCDFTTGRCVCPVNRDGVSCERCAAGFEGVGCTAATGLERYFPLLRIIGGSIALLFVVSIAVLLVVRARRAAKDRLSRRGPYSALGTASDEDDDVPTGGLPLRQPAVRVERGPRPHHPVPAATGGTAPPTSAAAGSGSGAAGSAPRVAARRDRGAFDEAAARPGPTLDVPATTGAAGAGKERKSAARASAVAGARTAPASVAPAASAATAPTAAAATEGTVIRLPAPPSAGAARSERSGGDAGADSGREGRRLLFGSRKPKETREQRRLMSGVESDGDSEL